jgi:hypothetical protein
LNLSKSERFSILLVNVAEALLRATGGLYRRNMRLESKTDTEESAMATLASTGCSVIPERRGRQWRHVTGTISCIAQGNRLMVQART